jgi:hypothetical protein
MYDDVTKLIATAIEKATTLVTAYCAMEQIL